MEDLIYVTLKFFVCLSLIMGPIGLVAAVVTGDWRWLFGPVSCVITFWALTTK